jgi:hypothetical protein
VPDPDNTPGPAPSHAAQQWLSAELKQRVAIATAAADVDPAALCEQWVSEGLARLEAQQAPASATPSATPSGAASDAASDADACDAAGSGRCSLRTGSRSAGPVPLPVQQ